MPTTEAGRGSRKRFYLPLLLILLVAWGCAPRPGQAPWGSGIDFTPGWGQLGRAARDSLAEPLVWAPAAGALLVSLGDLDQEISDWARDERPLFKGDAESASDFLLAAGAGLAFGSGLLADSGEDAVRLRNKTRGLGLGASINLATAATTWSLKQTTDRQRPDRSDSESFPSGHSGLAAANAAWFSGNLDQLPIGGGTRRGLSAGGTLLAWSTAWARVEAGKHHPADILAGLALGHWLSSTLQQGLVSGEHQPRVGLLLRPDRLQLSLAMRF